MSTVERALGGPEIEVVAKAMRRRFTLEYKRKIVREADGCKTPGAVGALLRHEGLYSSHLANLAGGPRSRGGPRRRPSFLEGLGGWAAEQLGLEGWPPCRDCRR
jgi:hypothetical protein